MAPAIDAHTASSRALGEDELNEPPASRADRHPQGHLLCARDGLSDEQVGHVRAGDEQHEDHERREDEHRNPECALQPGDAGPRRREQDLLVQEGRDSRAGRVRLERLDGVLPVAV